MLPHLASFWTEQISYDGQGGFAEAAARHIASVGTDAADPRALRLLGELALEHEEVIGQFPDLVYHLHKCREAVECATKTARSRNPNDN